MNTTTATDLRTGCLSLIADLARNVQQHGHVASTGLYASNKDELAHAIQLAITNRWLSGQLSTAARAWQTAFYARSTDHLLIGALVRAAR